MSESIKVIAKDHIKWVNKSGSLHRLDGPAVAWKNGIKEWFVNGKYHRVDGPAFEPPNGELEWWLSGTYYPSKNLWFEALKKEDQVEYLFRMDVK